jgi:ankyrin repeat protein
MVEQQLLQRASGCLGSEIDRDAAYAYAFMTINSKELPVSRLDEALELLVQSAKRGHVGARCSFGTLCDAFDYKNPVPHEEEVEWVSECSQLGSMSALRRLRILEPSKFKEVTQRIRYEHGGLCPELTKFLLWNCRLDIESGKPRGIVSGRIHYLAITGDIGALQNYPRPPDGNYDLPNTIGETPLLVACRAGHTAVAKFLLYSGSDPSICATTGATALHFLSSFNDKHIPGMASLLLQHGAKIDQLSHNTSIYKELFDSPFGITEGTPLLWAVAAGNLCAAKTLVDRGADPLKRRIKTSHEDEQYAVGLSSMAYAVKFHQYQMITILLSSARTAAKYKALQHRLNTTFEIVPAERYTALYAAVDCDAAVRFREYLIHGKDFWDATQRSVQLLIEFGVDPKISPPASDGNPSNPIIHAAYSGSLPTMKYLWNYKDGLLRPTPTEWHKALQTAVGMSLHSMFDFLVAHRADITPNKNIDQLAIENLMTITNDQHFVMGSLELIPEVASTSWMNVEKSVFETAIATEQFKAAESLYYRGNLDLTSRYEGRTLLGKFIMGSSELNNVDKKIEFLLSIHGKKDILYWDVDYLERSGLTALQAALCAPTTTGHTQLDVFSTVLKHFNDPEYLNAQIRGLSNHKYTGYSALHLAAYKGRLEAITELLEQPGIDKNLKNCRGETAADMCIIQEIRSIRAYECCNSILPTQSRTPLTEKPSTNLMIFYHLIRVGAQISKFSVMLRRTSQDKFDLIDREMGPVQNIPLSRKLHSLKLLLIKYIY